MKINELIYTKFLYLYKVTYIKCLPGHNKYYIGIIN